MNLPMKTFSWPEYNQDSSPGSLALEFMCLTLCDTVLQNEHYRVSLVVQWFKNSPASRGHQFDPWFGKMPHARANPAHVPTTGAHALESP